MKRILITATVAALIVIVTGISFYSLKAKDRATTPATRAPLSLDNADLWPVARSWAWNLESLTKRRVGICVRTTKSAIPEGTSPSIPSTHALPVEGEERHSGWLIPSGQNVAGRVTCQLIDFKEAGLGEAVGNQPLRLMVRLRVAGALIGIIGSQSALEGESFVVASEIEPRWTGDELHLLAVYTRTKEKLFAHHVIVQQNDGQ